MEKNKKIKLKPYNLEVENTAEGIRMIISAQSVNNKRYTIELDMGQWWMSVIHDKLSEAIIKKEADLKKLSEKFNTSHTV